jgi:sugar lactone lactonase YvrE
MIGESPLWSRGQLLWTDPLAPRLLVYSDDALRIVPTQRPVWSLAGLPGGDVRGTLDGAFCAVDTAGAVRPGADAPLDPGCRFNDMTLDPGGGLWAGVMHRGLLATRGAIFHAPSLDVEPRAVASGLGVPNGMKFSSDGSKLYVVDTLMRTLLAYPVHDDKLGEPVIISDFLGIPGKPDGMTLGPDGTFWVAMWGGGCVVQLAPDGAVLQQIGVPAPHVSSVCFETPDRLFVTTSRMRLSPRALAEHPGSGALFEINL